MALATAVCGGLTKAQLIVLRAKIMMSACDGRAKAVSLMNTQRAYRECGKQVYQDD
jgi:hypothetical protein